MKITLLKNENLHETEVTIAYDRMSERLQQMVRTIYQYDVILEAKLEDTNFYIPLEQLLYADYVDGKTFLYTKEAVYESKKTLTSLEVELENTSVMRIGKSTLMNVTYLESVAPYPNHRLLARMRNGENLVVSRKYINKLQDRVRRS